MTTSDTVALQADKKTVIATLVTTADFVPGTGYTVLVSKNIRNVNNVALGQDRETAFNFVDNEKTNC